MAQLAALAGPSPRGAVRRLGLGSPIRRPARGTFLPRAVALATALALVAAGLAVGQLPQALSSPGSSGSWAQQAEVAPPPSEAWPAGLQEAAGAAMAADAYAISAEGDHWRAANPGHGLEASFAPEGLRVSSGDDWSFGLATTAVGRGQALAPVAPAEVVAEAATVEYRRGELTEWYVNDARGIEQGFTLASPSASAEAGPVVVEMDLAGDVAPTLDDRARGLVLADPAGAEVARYDGLVAFDATGVDLPAHMELVGGNLRLVVDDAGAAYPLTIDPVINTQQAKLTAADAAAFDNFGLSVSVSGDTAVVGAPGDNDARADSGSAYVFVRTGATWAQQAKLTAADAAKFDQFGTSVSVSGDTAVVGAPGDDDVGPRSGSGSAYVFVRTGATWAQQAKLTAADAAAFDHFGLSVSVSGDTAAVGAPFDADAGPDSGSAYVFVRTGATWAQQAKLTAADAAGDDFGGLSVAVSGDTAVVGARLDDDAGDNSGSAYVFVRTGVTWVQQAKLTAAEAAAGDTFGLSVAVSGDTAVVGAIFDDAAAANSGSAYVFVPEVAPPTTTTTTTSTTVPPTTTTTTVPPVEDPCADPTIVGAEGDDVIMGTSGDDVIAGLGGDDFIVGRGGNDVICGGAGKDTSDGGDGNDVITDGEGNDKLVGGAGDDALRGGDGDDSLTGGKGDDRLLGESGDDSLKGGKGDDRLDGGAGKNTCDGGSGSNTRTNC